MMGRPASATARILGAVVCIGALLTAVSCSNSDRPGAAPPSTTAELPTDLGALAPGALLATPETISPIDLRIARAGADAKRVTYRSTSGLDGSPTAVTGAVFVPRAKAPVNGWPVVVFAHPTTGLLEECGPSSHKDLMGVVPQIEMLLSQGYLVVMPDYQGLGSKGPHPYLEPRTVGYDVIDSVRAARQVSPDASDRWVAYGASQGGQAAWAAAELAPTYGQGLDMVGAAALAPTADVSAMPQVAFDKGLSQDQMPLMQLVVNAVSSVDPAIKLDDYLSGFALENNDGLLQCSGAGLDERNRLVFKLLPDNLVPRDQAAVDRLSGVLRGWSLPLAGEPSPVPVLVMSGTADVMVRPDWVEAAARRACDRGDVVTWSLRKDEGHDNVDFRPAVAWIGDRFRNAPLVGACTFGGN